VKRVNWLPIEVSTFQRNLKQKDINMKRIFASMLGLGLISLGVVGCADTSSTKTETKMSTPGGTTTVTTEKDVKKTGDHPPAERP
jgi:hypothetical protein